MDKSVFEREYIVNIENIGESNLITNRGLLSILEDIACKHSDSVKFGINEIPITHFTWVLLAWKVEIKKRVTYGTKIKVRTWPKPARKIYTYRDFEVSDENGNIVAIATSKWALVNVINDALAKIPDEIIGLYSPNDNNIFDKEEIDKLEDPKSYTNEYVYTVQRRDIDVNKHVHNLNYLSLAYEALPENIYFSSECNHIEIMYKKSIKLGNTVKALYSNIDNAHFVTIKSEDESVLHAIIKLY